MNRKPITQTKSHPNAFEHFTPENSVSPKIMAAIP
jgi:hypothetical protein